MELNKIYTGDALEIIKTFPDSCVNCCVTSPPYYGLRDYGNAGQIGLEETPEQYVSKLVEVFREVKRVLRDDGTLWLNLGDSYAANGIKQTGRNDEGEADILRRAEKFGTGIKKALTGGNDTKSIKVLTGLKSKDLIGIPWAVAEALRGPWYNGKIKDERNRTWMAAIIDGEGSICGFDHERKDDGRIRTGINICVTNSNMKLLDRCFEIYPTSRSEHNFHGEGHYGSLPTYRWIVHGTENKILFLKEIYPYLIAKQKQALLAYNLLLFSLDAKRLGKTAIKDSVNGKRQQLVELISKLNHQEEIDIPEWCKPVDTGSLWEQGFYLRQDLIWSKPNPMPESVTDRCTKSHEYIFLLSKSAKYYYDADAIKEDAVTYENRPNGVVRDRVFGYDSKQDKIRISLGKKSFSKGQAAGLGIEASGNGKKDFYECPTDRNKRSVWTVTTKPYSDAHFATFPEDLIVDMIKAGCPEYGTVLDPFMGAGTTALVASKLNRNFIGTELNPAYVKLAEKRLQSQLGLFNPVKQEI